MIVPEEFDPIRSFEPEDLPAVYDRLTADPQFRNIVERVYKDIPYDTLVAKLRECHSGLEFQKVFIYYIMKRLEANNSKGVDMDDSDIDNSRNYTFISNHRDIITDSAYLDVMLIEHHFTTTAEIAIGDNLFAAPWIKDLVRLNKSFIVERSLPMREMLQSSARLSRYMHFSIAKRKENIWIAQREGRAKDSNDRTQTSILKMMCMGGEGSITEKLQQLHIVPLSISYEYDPCDYLKAQEFQLKRDNAEWKKSKADDMLSMQTGLFGRKGYIHYHCASCIDDWLATLDLSQPKSILFEIIAQHIDKEIHRNYRLYPGNYVALDMRNGNTEYADHYTESDKQAFSEYLHGQMSKIDIPNKDEPFLKEQILKMYSNPTINYIAANER
jgi:hypothetical protein